MLGTCGSKRGGGDTPSPLWSQQPDGNYRIPGMDTVPQSWDMAFKDKSTSDYVVRCGPSAAPTRTSSTKSGRA